MLKRMKARSSAEQTTKMNWLALVGVDHILYQIIVSVVEYIVVMTHLNPHMNMAYIDLNGS